MRQHVFGFEGRDPSPSAQDDSKHFVIPSEGEESRRTRSRANLDAERANVRLKA
jgi:hypothetical protein